MPDRCVVPGCKSNYNNSVKSEGYTRYFRLPKDPVRRSQWVRAIPRSDWIPSDRSVFCLKHFRECDLNYVEGTKTRWCEYRPDKHTLNDEAVPKVFPNLPSYSRTTKRKERQVRRDEENRLKKQDDDEKVRVDEENKIIDFQSSHRLPPQKLMIKPGVRIRMNRVYFCINWISLVCQDSRADSNQQ